MTEHEAIMAKSQENRRDQGLKIAEALSWENTENVLERQTLDNFHKETKDILSVEELSTGDEAISIEEKYETGDEIISCEKQEDRDNLGTNRVKSIGEEEEEIHDCQKTDEDENEEWCSMDISQESQHISLETQELHDFQKTENEENEEWSSMEISTSSLEASPKYSTGALYIAYTNTNTNTSLNMITNTNTNIATSSLGASPKYSTGVYCA